MDYSKFPSIITKSSELVLGLVYYHVYGHVRGNDPVKEEVITEPYIRDYGIKWFDYRSDVVSKNGRACGDCGLDGVNYNHNRMFKELDDALAFIEECEKEGIRKDYRLTQEEQEDWDRFIDDPW